MTGNDKSTVLGAATALVVNFMLAIILIPLLGLSGAAIGFAVSLTIWNVILMVMVKKKVGITTFLVLNDR
jgi:O-antigen/teichoic acid export membrane protein